MLPIQTRRAVAADHAAFARLFPALGVPDPLPSAAHFAAEIVPTMTVACAGDDVVGYVRWRRYAATAHVVNVVVDAAWRGRRIGEQLLACAHAEARAAGCTRWYLNVKQDNAPALALYRRCGFEPELESWVLRLPWAAALALPVAPGLACETAAEDGADDGQLAARFPFEAARLAALRARAGMPLLVLRDPAPCGFAAFSPTYPSAMPFAVAAPPLAGALLHACHARVAPDRGDAIHLAIEGDAALAAAMRAAGATLTFALTQLGARILPAASNVDPA